MPADFFIDRQRKIVFSKATGKLGYAEGLDHMDRLQIHPDFQPEFDQLFDFRDVTEVDLSHDDVRQLAERPVFSPRSRRAFVVSNALSFGVARMFQAYRDIRGESGITIFKEMKEALSWLSLSEEPDVLSKLQSLCQ